MKTFLLIMLGLHIAAGTLALLAGPVAMVAAKGHKLHRQSGRIYFYGMTGVFLSAVVMAVLKSLSFLLMVAFFSYFLVLTGQRALSLKKLHAGQRYAPIDWVIYGVSGLFGLGLLVSGTWVLLSGNGFGTVSVVFGFLMSLLVYRGIRRASNPPADPRHWLYAHLIGMGAGYISTATAFIVVNATMVPLTYRWLLPTVLGFPIIITTVVRLKRKYHEADQAREARLNALSQPI
jgi:uncharacterized membrane protein